MIAAVPDPRDPSPLALAGRWRSGFDGHHLYLLRADPDEEDPSPDTVKLGATMDLTRHLADLQLGNHLELRYVAVLPGNAAHKAHVARLFAAHRVRGDWYAAAPLLDFAYRVSARLDIVDAESGRDAMLTVLAELDPAIADLQRMWRNGTTAPRIAALTGLGKREIDVRIQRLRDMGYDPEYRYAAHAA